MTDTPAVIQATFHNFKPVLGRKQLQLIFEVPIEHMQHVLAATGAPGEANWFAIAKMENIET